MLAACLNHVASVVIVCFVLNCVVWAGGRHETVIATSGCLKDVQIRGPGWENPHIIFPSRYFFVDHPPDCLNRIKKVVVASETNGRCMARTQTFNETQFGNDMLIVRYRLVSQECSDMSIALYDDDEQLVMKRLIRGKVYDEECYCPSEKWPEEVQCDHFQDAYRQIHIDLSTFLKTRVNFSLCINDMIERFAPHSRSYSFCHYQIVDNEVYRKCYGEYIGFAQFMDDFLVSLTKKVKLPNTEFIANLGDWPLSSRRPGLQAIPVFSWCGSDDTYDIVLPTYETTESVLQMQGRVSVDILSVFGKQSIPFDNKHKKLFWRGRDSNRARLTLVELSKANFDAIDAAFTNFFFFRDEIDKYGPSVPHTNFFSFFNYKYQLNMDGTVAAYRFPNLLAGSSLVFKQDSKYYEFFYQMLKPNVHYIPIKEDVSDLLEILEEHIEANPSEERDSQSEKYKKQQEIIGNSRNFVLQQLMPSNIYCYYLNVILEYTKLLQSEVVLAKDMELASTKTGRCTCGRSDRDEL